MRSVTLGVLCGTALLAADPTPPVSVWVTSKTSVSLSVAWGGATDADNNIVRYRIQRDGIEIGNTTGLFWNDSGLAADHLYLYRIISEDATGLRSVPSADMVGQTLSVAASDPPAPTALALNSVGPRSLTLRWTMGGSPDPISRYLIYVNGVFYSAVTVSPATLSGLVSGTSVSLTVRAEDSLGNLSPPSTALNATPGNDVTVPGAVGQLVATAVQASSVALAWQPATDNTDVASYRISFARNGATAQTAAATATSFVLGVDNGQSLVPASNYAISVAAVDAVGLVGPPATVNIVTPADIVLPTKPQPPRATSGSPSSIALAWGPGDDNVGVTTWELQRDGVVIATQGSATFVDGGVVPGTGYTYRIVAIDAAGGRSAPSDELQVVVPSEDYPPPAPGDVRISARTATTLTLDWWQGADPGDSGVTSWTIERDGQIVAPVVASKPWTDTAPAGAVHMYRVVAVDRCGNRSPASQALTVRRDGDIVAPTAPAAPALTSSTVTSATLAWAAPAPAGDAIAYAVLRDGLRIACLSELAYTDGGRTPGSTVTYAVQAMDAAGNWSPASAGVLSTTASDTTAPASPTTVRLVASNAASVTLDWAPSTDDVGVTGYTVTRDGVQVATCTTPPVQVGGLSPGASGAFVIRAIDAAGNVSAPSAPFISAASADTQAPEAPQQPWTTALSATSVGLAWLVPEDDVAVSRYEVLRDGAIIATVTATTATDAAPVSRTSHAYTVIAIDAAGNRSPASPSLVAAIPDDMSGDRTAPSVPGNVRLVTAAPTALTVAWNASSDSVGVTGYTLRCSDRPDQSVTTLTATFADLQSNTSYDIVVTARDAAGNTSAASQVLRVSTAPPSGPPAIPPTPAGFAVSTRTATSLTYTWTAVEAASGMAGYEILSGGNLNLVQTVTGTQATITGLRPGISYGYRLRAVAVGGQRSPLSAQVNGSTLADSVLPTAPSTVSVGSVTTTSVSLSWSGAGDDTEIAAYRVLRGGTQIAEVASAAYTDTDLLAGTLQTYTIKTVDVAGNVSGASTATQATTSPDTVQPSTPSAFRCTNIGVVSSGFTWASSTDDVGVAGYRIYRDGVLATSVTMPSATIGNLASGSTAAYTIEAFDAFGNVSARSESISITQLADALPPQMPTSITLQGRSPFRVLWGMVGDAGNAGIRHYAVRRDGVIVATISGTNTVNLAPLSGSAVITVQAVDWAGNVSPETPALRVDNTETVMPTAPASLVAGSNTTSSVSLSWTASTDGVGGSGIYMYRIYRGTSLIGGSTTTSFTHTGVAAGSTATYTVDAVDRAGNVSAKSSGISLSAQADTIAPVIGGPPVVKLMQPRSVLLEWPSATDNLGIASYRLLRNGTVIATVQSPTAVDTGVVPGQSYTYTVIAVDTGSLTSASSAPLTVSIPVDASPPSTPVITAVTAIGYSGFTLAWSPADDADTVTYELLRDGIQVATATTPSYIFTGLTSGASADYAVRAKDASGNRSSASAVRRVVTLVDTIAPTAPTGPYTAIPSDSSLYLYWTAASDAQTSVVSYAIFRDGIEIATTPPATHFRIVNLPPATTSTFGICAVDANGNRSSVVFASGTTTADVTPPAKPVLRTEPVATASTVGASWDAPSDLGGIASYRVSLNGVQKAVMTSNSVVFGDLRPNTTQKISVVAVDKAGNASTAGDLHVATMTDNVAPTSPTAVIATPEESGGVALSWQAGRDDVAMGGYAILRDGVEVARVSATTFLYRDIGRTAGADHVYQVVSVDHYGNRSVASSELRIRALGDLTPPLRPGRPVLVSLAANRLELRWTAAWDRVGVADYVLLCDGREVATAVSTTWVGLPPATTRAVYVVIARDAAGNRSTRSPELALTVAPDVTPPAAPIDVRATDVTTSSLCLAWKPGPAGSGTDAQRYEVDIDGSVVGSSVRAVLVVARGAGTSPSQVRIRAADAAGNWSPWSFALLVPYPFGTGTTSWNADVTPPSLPGSPTAVVQGDGRSVSLQWAASTDASGIAGYQVWRRPVGGTAEPACWTDTTAWVDVRTPGDRDVTWGVRAIDRFGNASAEVVTAAIRLPADAVKPEAIQGLRLVAHDPVTRWARLAWTAPASLGDIRGWRAGSMVAELSSDADHADLVAAQGANVVVTVSDRHGNATTAIIAIPVRSDLQPPLPPTLGRIASQRAGRVQLAWAPGWDASGAVTYAIQRDDLDIGTSTTCTWTDATPPTHRSAVYRVVAVDPSGNQSIDGTVATSAPFVDVSAPTAPILAWKARTATRIDLDWLAGQDGAGMPAPVHELCRDGVVIATVAAGTRTWADTGVLGDTTYTYTLTAIDLAGNRSVPATLSLRTQRATVIMPRGLRIVAMDMDRATMAWDDPYDLGGVTTWSLISNAETLKVAAASRQAVVRFSGFQGGSVIGLTAGFFNGQSTGTMQIRLPVRGLSVLNPTQAFDAVRWAGDPAYRSGYLGTYDPTRLHQVAEPAPGVPVLSSPRRRFRRMVGESVDLFVHTAPGAPVTFTAISGVSLAVIGNSASNATITVAADANGDAVVRGTVLADHAVVVAASPLASGTVRFAVDEVTPPPQAATPATGIRILTGGAGVN